MPIPLKSKHLEELRERLNAWLYKHPVIAVIVVLCAVLVLYFSVWWSGFWALFTDKPFFPWLAEQMIAYQVSQISANWFTVPIGIVMLGIIIYLLATGRRERPAGETKASETTAKTDAKEPLPRWLQAIIDYQLSGLQKYVLVYKCDIDTSPLSAGKRYIEFTFHLRNYSMFYVSIPMSKYDKVTGAIQFQGEPLSGEAKLVENEVRDLNLYSSNYFKIRQWVNPDEAKEIPYILETVGNRFDFSKAIVYVKADEFPNSKAAELDLTYAMQNAKLENTLIEFQMALKDARAAQESLKAQHKDEINALKQNANVIRGLSYARGATMIVLHQLDDGKTVPEEFLQDLVVMIRAVIHEQCSDTEILEVEDKLEPIPSTQEEQRTWARRLYLTLSRLIEQRGGRV